MRTAFEKVELNRQFLHKLLSTRSWINDGGAGIMSVSTFKIIENSNMSLNLSIEKSPTSSL